MQSCSLDLLYVQQLHPALYIYIYIYIYVTEGKVVSVCAVNEMESLAKSAT